MPQHIIGLTANLLRAIQDLEDVLKGAARSAFMETLRTNKPFAETILKKELEKALLTSPEFSNPILAEPLRSAIANPNTIVILPIELSESKLTVEVEIALDNTAGTLVDFAQAVRSARLAGGWGIVNPEQASNFWRLRIYAPAMEGYIPKDKDGDPDEKAAAKGLQMYIETLKSRASFYENIAPYWSLLENGNAAIKVIGEDGSAYPVNKPTHFVELSRRAIERLFNTEVDLEAKRIFVDAEIEVIETSKLLEEIDSVVAEVQLNPGTYSTPQIVQRVIEDGRLFSLYITRTGRLGYSLRPQI